MRDRNEYLIKHGITTSGFQSGVLVTTIHASIGPEDRFEAMCRKNGGLVLNIAHKQLPQHLQEFIDLLRNRYIIEYPRPDEGRAGKHIIVISVHKSSYIVLPTGASTPLPDPTIASDPTTVPSSPSQAKYGGRKSLDPKTKQ
jgi:hypothetical protein